MVVLGWREEVFVPIERYQTLYHQHPPVVLVDQRTVRFLP